MGTSVITIGWSRAGNMMYDVVRYNMVPPLFLLFFTGITQWLVAAGHKDKQFHISNLFNPGSLFSWTVVLIFLLWSFISLKVPARTFLGPTTPSGYVPAYSANGVLYYIVSLAAYLALVFAVPSLPLSIWYQFNQIISSLNIFSLVLCLFLLIKGHTFPEVAEGAKTAPLPYQFYAGIELHPRLAGVDIKQWTNCRAGMMGWAILVINFAIASIQLNGLKLGPLVNALLINIYLFKFFHWETGYFNTLDITLDRAGYYLCWGCLTWVQVFLHLFCLLSCCSPYKSFKPWILRHSFVWSSVSSLQLHGRLPERKVQGIWRRMLYMGQEGKVYPRGVQNPRWQEKEKQTTDQWLLGPLSSHELCL